MWQSSLMDKEFIMNKSFNIKFNHSKSIKYPVPFSFPLRTKLYGSYFIQFQLQ